MVSKRQFPHGKQSPPNLTDLVTKPRHTEPSNVIQWQVTLAADTLITMVTQPPVCGLTVLKMSFPKFRSSVMMAGPKSSLQSSKSLEQTHVMNQTIVPLETTDVTMMPPVPLSKQPTDPRSADITVSVMMDSMVMAKNVTQR
jgi:hypothetical protein